MKKLTYLILIFTIGVVVWGIWGKGEFARNEKLIALPTPTPEKTISVTVIHSGSNSGYGKAREEIIKTLGEWQALWGDVTYAILPSSPVPEIDFKKEMVLGVFMGNRNTGGYNTEIKKIIESEGIYQVYVQETSPGKNCITTQSLTQPFQIVKIPKTDLKIEFIKSQTVRDC